MVLEEYLKDDDVLLVNIKKQTPSELCSFDTVVVGGSIHAGQVQRKIKAFCRNNSSVLQKKHLGLFLCCMEEGDTAQKQFDEAYPAELRNHATATGLFGGEFDFDKMNFIQKAIVKKVAGVTSNVSRVKSESIEVFATAMGA
jgi:menaquinone-dependent protoporphyrinogen oxidase